MKNSIGSKQALEEAQKRAEALASLGMVLFAPTTSITRLSPSLPFSDLLQQLCNSCGSCVRSRGSLVLKAWYKAQSRLQKILLFQSVSFLSVVHITLLAAMSRKRS